MPSSIDAHVAMYSHTWMRFSQVKIGLLLQLRVRSGKQLLDFSGICSLEVSARSLGFLDLDREGNLVKLHDEI
jgi:hypothetical protein